MLRRFFHVITMTLLILSACSKQSQEQLQGDIYFPKGSNGSQWEYGVRYSAPEGTKMGIMLIEIVGEETINGKTYYKQINSIKGIPGAGIRLGYYRRAKEGIYAIDDNTTYSRERLTTPFMIRIGDTWTAKTSDGQKQFKAEKIETVEINDKRYKNCLKVSFKTDPGPQHIEGISYFAPKIGEVYSVFDIGKVKVDYALLRYKL